MFHISSCIVSNGRWDQFVRADNKADVKAVYQNMASAVNQRMPMDGRGRETS
jgi:hypothetical protein